MLRRLLAMACLVPLVAGLGACGQSRPKAPSPYAWNVRMAFTPMALKEMAKNNDTFAVLAYYYGDPTPQARSVPAANKAIDALGRLIVGEERYGWTANQRRVHLDGNIDTSLLPNIRGDVQVLVSAYSVTKEGASDDLIACKTWIGTIKMAQEKPPLIACELDNGDKDSADDLVAADEASASRSSQ